MATASATTNVLVSCVPVRTPLTARPPASIHTKLSPKLLSCCSTRACPAFPMATTQITAAIPIVIPRTVSTLRILLQSALVALLRNKMRSVLTVLGITSGIAAVICVVAIGKAGQARVEQQLNNLGDNFVWIEAGGRAVNVVRTGTQGTKTLTYADAVAIKSQVSLIKSVSPNVDGPVQIIYGNQNWFTSFRGVSPEYFDIKRWY